MKFSGLVGLFRAAPSAPAGLDGKMALADHFRELRARLMRSVLAIVIAVTASFFFYDQLIDLVTAPYRQALDMLGDEADSRIYVSGVGGGLMLQLKLCGVAGLVISSPIWLGQIWGFIVPALHRHEKKWSYVFMAVAGPLFVAGVATSYYVLPKAMQVLISFTPAGMENLNDFDNFFSFITRMLLVFGIAFEIPLFVVMLNLVGVVSGEQLGRYRSWIIMGTFIFAAVATPSTDPFAMTFLAVPMVVLFLISEVIARLVDKSRARTKALAPRISDDEASVI